MFTSRFVKNQLCLDSVMDMQVNTPKPTPAIRNNQQSSYSSKSDADHHL